MVRSIVVATAGLLAVASTDAPAQTARQVADGVYLLPAEAGRAAAWVDLGPDVLGIVGGPDTGTGGVVARIRRASGKPIRLLFAPNGLAAPTAGSPPRLVPEDRGTPAGGFGFRGTITVGGTRRVEIRELEYAVSPGNGVVYLPAAGVLFAGDLVGPGATVDSTRIDAWIAALGRLGRLDPRVVVPGRGAAGGPELIEKTRTALVTARDHVARGIDGGRPIEQIASSLSADAAALLPPGLARAIYREMVGLRPPPMIDELGLRPGPSPTSETPGWTRPTAVLVRDLWPDSPGRIDQLKLVAPGVEIRVARTGQEAATLVAGADASLGWLSPEILRRGDKLRWLQWPSAGVEGVLRVPGLADSPITLTNAQRIYGPPIAEHVFGLLLGLTRRVHVAVPLMKERRWEQDSFPSEAMPELRGKTMLVAGLGGIGTEVARLAHGLGMRVIATRSSRSAPTDIVEYIGGSDELATLAPEADVIVDCLPLTRETAKVFDQRLFDAMKPKAYFVNIGRGGTVDTDALIRALESNRVAGAGLDVTDPEPLPPDHRLWSLPNVIITPHVASGSDWERDRTWLLFRENLRRFANGEPLLSVVDKKAGY